MENYNNNKIFSGWGQAKLRGKIMRRVYMVWLVRKILSPATAKALILVGIVRQLFIFVSVKDVMINAPSVYDIAASFTFFGQAFMHTGLSVQLSLLASLSLFLWIIHDFVNSRELSRA